MAFQVGSLQKTALLYYVLQGTLVLLEQRAAFCIDHVVDVCLHLGLLDSVEVVSDAHVEDEVGLRGLAGECRLDQMNGKPCLEVLVIGLLQGIFGGPLHVVSLVAGVDARFCYLQVIHDLNRLQFHEAAAGHVGADYVLGKLGMGTCRRSQRCCALLSENLDGVLSARSEEILLVDSEYRAVVAVFPENPLYKFLKWNRTHSITHNNSPFLIYS